MRMRIGAALGAAFMVMGMGVPAGAGPLPACPAPGGPGSFVECFDDEPSGSATSAGSFAPMTAIDGLILSAADASFLLGLDASAWPTSGDQGVLNALVPVLELDFSKRLVAFQVDVVALPGLLGEPVPVVVQAFRGDTLRETVLSDVSGVLGDGTHADQLAILDPSLGFDRVRIFAAALPCSGTDCIEGGTTSFFADTVHFTVPEPGAAPLLGGVALLAILAGALRGRSVEGL